MNKAEIIERLRNDEDYYGSFGKQFLSNSDIYTLLNNPAKFGKPQPNNPAFMVGGYFHTAILEPDKIEKYKIIQTTSRNTKVYKEATGGEICLLQHEVDQIEAMRDKMLSNDICRNLIYGTDVDYEVPGIIELEGNMWKGKADIVNHEEKLIIDLKTTKDINKFRSSAWRYNYDSQAYIYSKLFGYEFLFIVVDKTTHQIGLFDCSPKFYESGKDKVTKATGIYDLYYKTENFDFNQHIITNTL